MSVRGDFIVLGIQLADQVMDARQAEIDSHATRIRMQRPQLECFYPEPRVVDDRFLRLYEGARLAFRDAARELCAEVGYDLTLTPSPVTAEQLVARAKRWVKADAA